MVQSKALIFSEIPTGWPEAGKHLRIERKNFDINQRPPPGGITVKLRYASFDPYQRSRMRAPGTKSYAPPYDLNKPVTSAAIVTVLESDNDKFQRGQLIRAMRAYTEEYTAYDKEWADTFTPIPLGNPYNLDLKHFLGALGSSGLTAYSSLAEIGQPKKGETIFISAASGAVGQMVGQLAKHQGLTVIGSVGDEKKLSFIVDQLGFDGGFNYKQEKPSTALQRLAPRGIDIYYDNVGGEQLEAAIAHMNDFGRIVACGMISQYNVTPEQAYPIRNLMQVVAKRLTIRGFIVADANMGPKHTAEHQENVQKWISEGKFTAVVSETHGMQHAVEGLIGMFEGKNFGKAVLVVDPL